MTQVVQTGALWQPGEVGWGGWAEMRCRGQWRGWLLMGKEMHPIWLKMREGGREVQERGDICIPMADSGWCMAGTKTIL